MWIMFSLSLSLADEWWWWGYEEERRDLFETPNSEGVLFSNKSGADKYRQMTSRILVLNTSSFCLQIHTYRDVPHEGTLSKITQHQPHFPNDKQNDFGQNTILNACPSWKCHKGSLRKHFCGSLHSVKQLKHNYSPHWILQWVIDGCTHSAHLKLQWTRE